MSENTTTHHGSSFEVHFMAKIGEISQEFQMLVKKLRLMEEMS